MKAREHCAQLVCLYLASEAELARASANPLPGGFALTGALVLDPGGDRVEVVGLLALAELADRDS